MVRTLVVTCLLCCAPLTCLAQAAPELPDSPAYRGEIRRSADGKLIAVEGKRAGDNRESLRPATLIVGPQEQVRTITEAAKAARDGDIIEILPGDYRGQPAIWTQDNLIIRGKGPRPVLIADGKSAENKGLWVIRGGS